MYPKPIIGRRELVSLPDWHIKGIEAKIDTGAKTSAIHVEAIKLISASRVRFYVVTGSKKPYIHTPVIAELVRRTRIRSSSGHSQERYIVSTRLKIGNRTTRIEVSLVRRDEMLCRMLIGRTALEGFLVDVSQKHMYNDLPKKKKRTKT